MKHKGAAGAPLRLRRLGPCCVPDILSIAAEDMLADAKWQNVSWRNGTKGRLKARFAAVRVRAADGPPQRIWDKGQQHLPGDEAWLIGEHRTSGENKYYLANLPAGGQPANRGGPAHISCHYQGAMDLRAGSSATERGTRSRSLRRTIGGARLISERFWAISASGNGEWGNGRIRHAAQAAGTSVGGSAQISGIASRSRATRSARSL